MDSKHWFWGAVLKQKRLYLQIIIASVCVNLFALASAFFVMTVYDRVIPNNATETLISLTVGISIVLVFDFIMKTLRASFTDLAGQKIDQSTAGLIFDRISRNERLINGYSAGAVASRVKEFDLVKDVLASATLVTFVDLPFIFLFIGILYLIGGPVVVVPLIIVIVVIGTGLLIQPVVKRLVGRADTIGHDKHSVLVEVLAGLETVKTLRGIDAIQKRWESSVKNQGEALARSRFWAQLSANIAQSGQQVAQVGIVVFGVYLIAEAGLTMGGLIACVILSGRTLAPLGQVSNVLGRMNQALSAYRSMDTLIRVAPLEMQRSGYMRHADLSSEVDIDKLGFAYVNSTNALFEDLSLKLASREKVAVLGPVGSGKSTLIKILSGVLSPSKGVVRVGGVNLSHLHPEDMRRAISVVNQSPVLFSGTLKENILFGNPSASDQELIEVCRATGVDQIADQLENGYETYLSEKGAQLSGGQKQLVSIARALVGKPHLLLMDEPTSALDNISEQELLRRIKPLIEEITVIVVTHRSSVLAICERVVVIDRGSVIKDGSKAEVLGVNPNSPSSSGGDPE